MDFKDKSNREWAKKFPIGTPVIACFPIPGDWADMNWEEMPAYRQRIGYVVGVPKDKEHGYIEVPVRYSSPNGSLLDTWSWPCVSLQPL